MRYILISIFCFVLPSETLMAGEYMLELRENAVVDSESVSLSDIVIFPSGDKTIPPALRHVKIAKSPLPMYSATLSRHYVQTKINRSITGSSHSFSWKGSKRVLITRKSVLYKAESYTSIAKSYLHNKLSENYSDVELKPVGVISDIYLPSGTIRFSPRINTFTNLTKRVCIWLDVEVAGKQWATLPVWFSVKAYRDVYVSKSKQGQHKIIDLNEFEVVRHDVAGLTDAPILSLLDQNKYRLKKRLDKGKVLTKQYLEMAPDVVKGQEVVVNVWHKEIKMQVTAIAEDNGFMGDVITLQNKRSAETFKAVVIGPSRLEIRG